MTITQIVDIPADRRLIIDVPCEISIGVKARVEINIPAKITKNQSDSEIEYVRQLLRNEMSQKETSAVTTKSGDGWEAYVRERYAES